MEIAFQVSILLLLFLFTMKTYRTTINCSAKMTCTTRMMSSMIVGSMVGLVVGTMFALNFSYGINSILATIIGMFAGILIGIPLQSMAILEGMMGGVMGGLMGAMLGEMLPVIYIYILTIFLLLIYVATLYLLDQSIKEEIGMIKTKIPSIKQVRRLSVVVSFVTIVLFSLIVVISQYNDPTVNHSHHHHSEHQHSEHNHSHAQK